MIEILCVHGSKITTGYLSHTGKGTTMWIEVTLENKTQGLVTYDLKFNTPDVFVNKVLLEHSYIYYFMYYLWVLSCIVVERGSCNRGHVAHTAENIFYLSLCKKRLPTPVLNQRNYLYLEIYWGKNLETMRKIWASDEQIEPCWSEWMIIYNIFQ